MAAIVVSVTRAVRAPAPVVYNLIADYHNGHPRILPDRYFGPLLVERGGVGAGTEIRFTMKGFGPARELTADIEEPEPGRVVVERYSETGGVTTFTVQPAGSGCDVTIKTEWTSRGLQGLVERVLAPPFLRRVFDAELAQLEQVASSAQVTGTGNTTPDRVVSH